MTGETTPHSETTGDRPGEAAADRTRVDVREIDRLPGDRRPLHTQVYEHIVGQIDHGLWREGDKLPAEVDLAVGLGVSRSVLREALRALERSGHVQRRHGHGTFVSRPVRVEAQLPTIASLEVVASSQSLTVAEADRSIRLCTVVDAADDPLGLGAGGRFWEIRRTKAVSGRRAALFVDRVAEVMFTRAEIDARLTTSVLDLLLEKFADRALRVIDRLSPEACDDAIAARLAVPPGTLLMTIEETVFDPGGTAIAWSRAHHLAARFDFKVERTLGDGAGDRGGGP
ncbi:MAG: GntR family transcriptional regulator [Azospirillaceae bacterium]